MDKFKKYKYPIILTLISFVILVSFQHCGSGGNGSGVSLGLTNDRLSTSNACANSAVNGKWNSTTEIGKNLIFYDDCHYTNEFCKSSGTYPANITSDTGTALVTVETRASDAPVQCQAVGTESCQYRIDKSATPNELEVICGNVWGVYTKAPASSSPSQTSTITPVATTSTQLCSQHTLVSPKVDVLLLWDNSSSALFINSATKNSLNQLITSVSEKFDYHILSAPLISTNSNSLYEASLLAKDASSVTGTAAGILTSRDQATAALNFSSAAGSNEPGVDRATSIIEENRSNGIFRNDAYTIIVVMSNADDTSCESETGYSACATADWTPRLQSKINKLLCLRGNASGIDCSGTTTLNSTMMRFINISALTSCSIGQGKTNNRYRKTAKALYETPYTNGWPTANDNLNPFISNGITYPDNYDICSIDFNHLFDRLNASINQTVIKHVYSFWPIASANSSLDPDTLRVVRDDGKILTNRTGQSNPTDGFAFIGNQTNHFTRVLPTQGEPYTGQMIQLFGSQDNDLITSPRCLTVTFDAQKLQYGYIYLKNGEPYVPSIEVRINGQIVPSSSTNGWDYMGLQYTTSLDSSLKIVDQPNGASSGYFIRLNGSYKFNNTSGAATSVNVNYTSKSQ